MKRIAIFCDGTWNRPDAAFATNVYKLHRATRQTAGDGVTQLPKYIPGVGTGFGMTGFAKTWDKIRGGVFGAGVTRNIMTAYRFIAEQYEPGDQIFIFGFSRGAFTARSLAGLIRASGLPRHDQAYRDGEALKRYRDDAPETRPDTPESFAFRAEFCPHLATSPEEQDWREAQGMARPPLLNITYMGVWDTVGAMGVPGHYRILARIFNGSHGFHDLKLSSSVKAARHAVSIDETRKTFPPTIWENLGDLNQDDPDRKRYYLQHWFPGDHGSVGGGGDIVGLSNIALAWVAEGAAEQGLGFDTAQLEACVAEECFSAPLCNQTKKPGFVARLLRRNVLDRVGAYAPPYIWDVSKPARQRWHHAPSGYRPKPLMHLADALDRTPPRDDAAETS
ncbi:DUF2235 domain-containing protein [Salipiger abyssi]|uniref:DUF2235 domain-containing protein n=1 Tax=Salipiger abyssi TaxID=1250539 RepID=UPI004059FECC